MNGEPGKDFERLYEAADAFLAARPEGETDDSFLDRNARVRDLLEPMLSPAAAGEELERTLGDFRVLREIGRGGMGVVYEARQISLNRRVALKVLPAHLTLRPESIARFHREAKTAARLDHPGIVDIHAVGSEGDTHYFAMEFIEGAPLDRVLARVREACEGLGSLDGVMLARAVAAAVLGSTPDEARQPAIEAGVWPSSWVESVVRLVLQVADALEHAHVTGVIHRDVKPSNMLVRPDGTAALTDFGLAREMGLPSLTMTGDFAGTPHYVSPEQVKGPGRKVDQRSDVFALGVTLYELLTLQLPFPGNTAREVLDAIRLEDPADPRKHNPKLAPDLAAIVLKALEKDPDRRYQRAQAFAEDLRAFLDYRPVQARRTNLTTRLRRSGGRLVRRHPALLAGAGVGLAALVIGAFLSEGRGREVELEYSRLCALAETETSGFLSRSVAPLVEGSPGRRLMQQEFQRVEQIGASPRVLYDRAIALLPGRPEGWFGRALAPGSPLQERLVDLDAALARGLSARTFHLARAYLLGAAEKSEAGERERALAAGLPRETPEDDYFEGIFQSAAGNRTQALEFLTRAIDSSPKASGIRYRALRARGTIRNQEGDHAGALADLHVLLDQGDDAARTSAQIALSWRALEKPDEAERWFQEALRLAREQSTVAVWSGLCQALVRAPWFAQATEEALAAHPEAVETLILRADALREEGRREESLALCQRALALHPADPGLLHALAITFVRLEKYGEALAALERTIELEPGNVGYWRNKGNVLGRLGRCDEALDALAQAERLDPTHWHTFLSRGALMANKLQRYEEALAQFDRARALGGWDSDLHLNRARVLRRLKRFAEALQAADQALAVTPAGNPNRAEVFRVRAMVIADAQGPEAALAVLLEASQLHPDDVDARTDRGVLLDKLGRHEEALAAFEEALALDGRRAFNWRNKAFVLRSLKRYDQALEAIDEAIRCRDDVPKYHSWRGTLLHNDLGRYEDALAAIEKALQLDPGGAMDWTNKAVVLRSLKRYDEALEAMDEAVRLDGGDAGRYDWRGTLLHNEMRRNEEALAAFEKALQLDPRQAVTWHNKAIVLRGLRSYDQALEAIDEAIRLEERNPLHLTLRGELLTEHFARYEEARADFARALELKPGLLQAQRHLGIALKQLGKYGEAVSAFDSALAIDGRDAYALYMRGSCLYMLDDHEAAAESVVRSLALDPGFKPTHCLHGAVLMALGRPNEALEAYQRADALGPGDPLLHDSRGQALAALGRHEEALADFDAALRLEDYGNAFLRLEPNRASTHYRRGRSLHALHRYEEAVAAYDVALARNGQLYECRRWRAEALVALQRFEDALGEIERMLAEKPLDAWAQNEHAFVLACLGRLEQVREPAAGALEAWIWTLAMLGRFEQALQHAQVLADPFPHIYCLRANGKVDAAREAARAATQGPVPASGQLRFAYLCAAAGDAEKARAALEACVLPWHPQAMYERVRIHCLLGDREAAIEWFRRAVDAGLRRPGNMAPDPDLQGIAADPRYRSLLERMRC